MASGAAESRLTDTESRGIIYDGASVSQLGKIFGMDNRNVAEKIRKVTPVGERGGHVIYAIKDVARYLAPPAGEDEIIAYIQRMNPREMPAAVNKDFWQGVKARREYEHFSGDLWSTEEVKYYAAEQIKHFRLALLMLTDQIAREEAVSEKAREVIQRLTDRTMEEARARFTERFVRRGPSVSGGDESEDGGL